MAMSVLLSRTMIRKIKIIRSRRRKVVVLLLIYATAIIANRICININRYHNKIETLKKIMANDNEMTPEFHYLAKKYLQHPNISYYSLFHDRDYFLRSNKNGAKLKVNFFVLPHFGNALLASYANNITLVDKLEIVEDIIMRTHEELRTQNKLATQTPWGENWYQWSVTFTRMMAMYEYLGKNDTVKTICHQRILEILPKLGVSFGHKRHSIHFVYLAIPRLLTNYLNDIEAFEKDVSSSSLQEMNDTLNLNLNPEDENHVMDKVYNDSSAIFHRNVATYGYVLSLGGFYLDVYKALGFETNAQEFITNNILPKLLHPDLPFASFGLIGRENTTTYTNIMNTFWRNYNSKESSEYGVHIMPIIGLGIFKSDKFMFSIRVQRPGIAAYESDSNEGEYALGWVQMRKMYLTNVYKRDKSVYGNETNWDIIKNQPGVISVENGTKCGSHRGYLGTVTSVFTRVIRSHIGRLPHHNVMFWINEYRINKLSNNLAPYEAEIHEFGVCTDNGVVMNHRIFNKGKKELKIKVTDNDNMHDIHFISRPRYDKTGYVKIKPNKKLKSIHWRMIYDQYKEPRKVDWNDETKTMVFKHEDNVYRVTDIDMNLECDNIVPHAKYFLVTNMRDNMSSIGSSKSNLKDSCKYNDTNYTRNSKSLMYIPIHILKSKTIN